MRVEACVEHGLKHAFVRAASAFEKAISEFGSVPSEVRASVKLFGAGRKDDDETDLDDGVRTPPSSPPRPYPSCSGLRVPWAIVATRSNTK